MSDLKLPCCPIHVQKKMYKHNGYWWCSICGKSWILWRRKYWVEIHRRGGTK